MSNFEEFDVEIDSRIFRQAFPNDGSPQHPASQELFEKWHANMMERLRNYCRTTTDCEITPPLALMIHDMQWLSWNARPLFVSVEEKDTLIMEGMKLLKADNEDLKAENRQLRHTIEHVLSDEETE